MSENVKSSGNKPGAKRRPGKGGLIGIIIAGVVLVLGGIYIAGYLMAGNAVPRDTTVAGVRVGGLSRDEAVSKLKNEYAAEADAPITVVAGDARIEVKPADAGLSVNYEKTIDASGVGKSWAPAHIWRVLTGGGAVAPVKDVDQRKLQETVGRAAGEVNRESKNAELSLKGTEPVKVAGQNALELDQQALVKSLEDGYLSSREVTAKVQSTEPQVTDAEVDQAIEQQIKPALNGPITVDTGQGKFDVTPAMIAAASKIDIVDGAPKLSTDSAKLLEKAQPAIAKLDLKGAKDASYKKDGDTLTVVPSVDGSEVGKDNFEKAVMPAIPSTERSVKLELTGAKAKFTTEQAEQQKPKQVIGEFTTKFPHADYRNTNLGLAAQRINGNTVATNGVFSLDKALGPRTSSNGYVDGTVIAGAKLEEQTAGGISQSATTVFNAAWFAGLEDIEHQPHTMYFDRYPAGRESTIYSGSIDVKFRNTTDNAIYIEAYRQASSPGTQGSITVRIWGTKKWDIESPEPVKSDYYNTSEEIKGSGPSCIAQSAQPGFTASYYRVFKVNGSVVKREDKSWKYDAVAKVTCN
ncbi:VanW family protein [Granulicoccus phenolivorans]|uniref:VanW family protein n=1 Tax=Granulicoccus phenolivorans TaxID=266854 RepID=UPI000AB28181|nr:VanW family protein [Granulicoccus phenolivorans]